jgi:hypothetical protein
LREQRSRKDRPRKFGEIFGESGACVPSEVWWRCRLFGKFPKRPGRISWACRMSSQISAGGAGNFCGGLGATLQHRTAIDDAIPREIRWTPAWRNLKYHLCSSQMRKFGEAAEAKNANREVTEAKLEPHWIRCVRLGRSSSSGERVAGRKGGVFVARPMRRALAGEQVGRELPRSIKAYPWGARTTEGVAPAVSIPLVAPEGQVGNRSVMRQDFSSISRRDFQLRSVRDVRRWRETFGWLREETGGVLEREGRAGSRDPSWSSA